MSEKEQLHRQIHSLWFTRMGMFESCLILNHDAVIYTSRPFESFAYRALRISYKEGYGDE